MIKVNEVLHQINWSKPKLTGESLVEFMEFVYDDKWFLELMKNVIIEAESNEQK